MSNILEEVKRELKESKLNTIKESIRYRLLHVEDYQEDIACSKGNIKENKENITKKNKEIKELVKKADKLK